MLNAEVDLEQLEQYLDGALDADAMASLQTRLGTDADLSAALATLKADRVVRSAVWLSMEPDAATTDRLMWRVRGAMLQHQQTTKTTTDEPRRFWSQWRLATVGSAAAACLVLGFAFGRIGQKHSQMVNPSPSRVDVASGDQPMLVPDEVQPAADRSAIATGIAPVGNTVPIADEYGHIITVQKFATPEDARHFAEDLHRTHPAGNTAPAGPMRNAAQDQIPQVPF